MTDVQQLQDLAAEVLAGLTAPGQPLELDNEDVLGVRMTVFKNRDRSLGALLPPSTQHGERDYLVTAERRISFVEHVQRVASLATSLRDDYGVRSGDRVAIIAANSPEWVIAFWAITSVGAITVAGNAWWSPRELAAALALTDPTLVVADEKRASLLTEAATPVLTIEQNIESLCTRYPQAELPEVAVDEDDPATILFTSGTSGTPKGVVHSHRNLLAVVDYHRLNDALAAAFGDPTPAQDKRYLMAMPLFHIGSLHNLAVPRLATGSTAVIHSGAFDVDRVLRLIESAGVTHWGAAPTMAHRLLEHGDLSRYDLSSLRALALASAPSSTAFKNRLRAALPAAEQNLAESYGLTESSTSATVASPLDLAVAPDSVGRPIVTVEVQIRDEAGRPLPDGTEGEVCLRSPFNMLGYWRDPDATAKAITPDRWLRTGDIGTLTDGRLRLTTRRSDLIIRGGENVYPAEVEAILAEHPAVNECAVVGVEHPDLGQEVAAIVVVRDTSPSDGELREFLAAELAYYKVPTRWRLTTEPLPRNATGKVRRAELSV
jgi:acyl-CoA synthetase (AMP-forming)/AMP-acid ligase II